MHLIMKSGGDRAASGSGGNCQFFSHRSSSLQNWYQSKMENEKKTFDKKQNTSIEHDNYYSPDITKGF